MGANIKNNHVSALGVGDVPINPGKTAYIPKWERVKHAHAIKVWLAAGLIEIVDEDVTEGAEPIKGDKSSTVAPSMPGMDPEAVEKQNLIDELRDVHGIEKTMKTSLASLQKQVTEARKSAE